jgi:hypothetical protein
MRASGLIQLGLSASLVCLQIRIAQETGQQARHLEQACRPLLPSRSMVV